MEKDCETRERIIALFFKGITKTRIGEQDNEKKLVKKENIGRFEHFFTDLFFGLLNNL